MPKYVPEIRISRADYSRMESDIHSEQAMSDVATDCETLDANYSKKPEANKKEVEKLDDDDVLLTDIDASSDDERETVIRYPIDCINNILNLGMSCEEVSNSQGPNKRQKSITCSLERGRPRSINDDKYDEGDTDVEGMYLSEDEDACRMDSDDEVQEFEPTAFVSISDKVVTGTILSPRVTPEPGALRKKKSPTLRTPVPISSVLTDTEMLISDSESNLIRTKKSSKVKPFKTMFDGFASDTEDSDTSLTPKVNCRPNKKMNCSRSIDSMKHIVPMQSTLFVPLKNKSLDGEQALTDTEHIYFDDKEFQYADKRTESRPSVIRMNKPTSLQNSTAVRYRHNAAKPKTQPIFQKKVHSPGKSKEKTQKQQEFFLHVALNDDTGNATDIEAFGSDSDDLMDVVQPVAYLPNPKCELIIDNESHKGKMSIILPIRDSKKSRSLQVEEFDCGYSDVEELPGYEAEEYFKCPTPDLPRTEHSTVENKEVFIDRSGLKPERTTKEPLTDTEDLDVVHKPTGDRIKVGHVPQKKTKDIKECHTDIEDLDGSDNDNHISTAAMKDTDLVELTDVGELSSDDSDDDIYRFTAVTPDLELNSTYTNAREAMSPFSLDVKRRIYESIPKIRTISPSPIPRHTDTEDFLASQEESANSNWDAFDDVNIEPHSSVVHIKHTRKFNVDHAERQHIKGFVSQIEPTTDIEELTMLEALEELRKKKRKYQKSKEQNEATVKTCYTGPKWQPCNQNTRFNKSSSRHEDKFRGADKSKGAVDPSWISLDKRTSAPKIINTTRAFERMLGIGKTGDFYVTACYNNSMLNSEKKKCLNSSDILESEGETVAGGIREKHEEGHKSPYDNIDGIFYKEMADQTVYPPHLGYAEFESDVLGSNSSLTQEPGTDTFSELLFSTSNSESEEPDGNFPISRGNETCGILYDMSSHINKVPELFAKRSKPNDSYDCEVGACLDSSTDSLESRLKYYHKLCNRSLSPEIRGISPAERSELRELEESISQMLIDIRREESLFYSDNPEEATNTVKRRPNPFEECKENKFKKINDDGESALKEIESHISKLLKDVEKEEREVMGSLRRDFKKSSEKLTEDEPGCSSTWDMINATFDNGTEGDISYVRFHESSCTPSPVESASTSEDEFDLVVPKVKLNIGSKLGRSTIDISVENSSTPRRRMTKMRASRQSLNRSYPNLKSSSLRLMWKDHNSTECLLEPEPLFQSSSIEYISPPERIERGSGYCIWSYPGEDENGQDQTTRDEEQTLSQHNEKEPSALLKELNDNGKVEETRTGRSQSIVTPSLERQDSEKRKTTEETGEISTKESPIKCETKISEKKDPKIPPFPDENDLTMLQKTKLTKEKTLPEVTGVQGSIEILPNTRKSQEWDEEVPGKTGKSQGASKGESTTSVEAKKGKQSAKSEKNGSGKLKREGNQQSEVTKDINVEEKIIKHVIEPSKTPTAGKKTTILGKTIETIKKPFQDKGEEKSGDKATKQGKGKGKGKQKSVESIKDIEVSSPKETLKQPEDATGIPKTESRQIIEEINKQSPENPTAESVHKDTVIDPEIGQELKKRTEGSVATPSKHIHGKSETSNQENNQTTEEDKMDIPEVAQIVCTTTKEVDATAKDGELTERTLKSRQSDEIVSLKEERSKVIERMVLDSPQAQSLDEGIEKQPFEKIEKRATTVSVKKTTMGADESSMKGREKPQTPKNLSLGDGVVEPLIEKSVKVTSGKDARIPDKQTEIKETKEVKGSPKYDKKMIQEESKVMLSSFETSSFEEVQKSDSSMVGKAVEIIKKPFQEQIQEKGNISESPKVSKVTKLESIDSSSPPAVDEALLKNVKSTHPKNILESDGKPKGAQEAQKNKNGKKKDEKQADTENKSKSKGKGKQKSIESFSSPSPEKDETDKSKTQSGLESGPSILEITSKQGKTIPEKPNKKDEKNKKKQKSIDLEKSIPKGKEDDIPQLASTPEPSLLEKTLGSIKKPFQGKKVEDTAKPEQDSKEKVGKRNNKQKSIETSKPPTANQDLEEKQGISENIVTLIKELPQDISSQIVEVKTSKLVTEPIEDFPNNTTTSTIEENITSVTHMKDGEDGALTLVSRPFVETMHHSEPPSSEGREGKSGQMVEEVVAIAAKSFEKIPGGLISSGKEGTTSTATILKEVTQDGNKRITRETSIGFESSTKTVPSTTTTLIEERLTDDSGQIVLQKVIETVTDHSKDSPKKLESSKEVISSPATLMKEPFPGGKMVDVKTVELVIRQSGDGTGGQYELITPAREGPKTTDTLMKKQSLDESGSVIEEQAISLMSKPIEDSSKFKVVSVESDSSSTFPILEQLSKERSGKIIEEKSIDLVAKPLENILGGTPRKEEFEHIQKTIDEAKSKLEQFVGIVSEKASNSLSNKPENEKDINETTTIKPIKISDSSTDTINQGDEVEIPVERGEDASTILKNIKQGLKNEPLEKDEFITKHTKTMKPVELEAKSVTTSGIEMVEKTLKRKEEECTSGLAKSGDLLADEMLSFQEPFQPEIQKVSEVSNVKLETGLAKIMDRLKSVDDGNIVIQKTTKSFFTPQDEDIRTLTTITTTLIKHDDTSHALPKDHSSVHTTTEIIGNEAVGQAKEKLESHALLETGAFSAPTSEPFRPELHAQSVKLVNFEVLDTIPPEETKIGKSKTIISEISASSSSSDEIGRIIKEMESHLLSTKFGMDESTIEEGSEIGSEDWTRECRTLPTTPLSEKRRFTEENNSTDSNGEDAKPYVTTPTLSRRVIGVGGSQRLTQSERPVVRVITEYVGDLSESEPEEDTYTVLEPEVKERRKFKIRFTPDMYGSEEREDIAEIVEVEEPETDMKDGKEDFVHRRNEEDSRAKKQTKCIERRFERMTSQTKEADPSMSEVTDGEFQRMVSQLSLEEMDQALHQWDIGGLTPSEIDSKDLTLSSDDTTSPLQQGLSDIFRPKLSTILPTSIFVEKDATNVGSSGITESSKMKLSLVKDTVPQIFRSVEMESQVKDGSHTLEPGETGETPPIPSPRTPLKPTDIQNSNQDQSFETQEEDVDESKNYASRKMFWEQISSGSVEAQPVIQDITPPVPKPRIRNSISHSIDLSEEKKTESHSEASTEREVSEIGKSDVVLQGITTTERVVHDTTTEQMLSFDADTNSEIEFIKIHDKEELSYDNDAFDDETVKDLPFPEPRQRKPTYERSVSLPGDSTIDARNNVRTKKRIFEAQIKKEMVVEQLMSQMEEEGSPEHKSFELTPDKPTDEEMLNRNIHSEIVSHELEEQIESHLLENKALVQKDLTPSKGEQKLKETIHSEKANETNPELHSETEMSSKIAEVLQYKNEMIARPSDSLEVCVDKSELEDTEKVKEIEEELRVIEEKYESHQLVTCEQTKVSSITSSQGESEDTFSESDVTPEDVRFKEQLDTQVWGPSEKDFKITVEKQDEHKIPRSVHTPEEHIPDTVWEVPVQENTEPLEVETVGQLPATASLRHESKVLTESEARTIAEIFVDEIEDELIISKELSQVISDQEPDITKVKTTEKMEPSMLKLIRTDTTTSSMEITDEDLRSVTDNSPLESQVGPIPHTADQENVFDEDSGDDVDARELDTEVIGKEVVEKTLAEVKQSLEAVKEELIEEKKKKRDSITKESPSEFEFKSLVLEKTFSESIQEHYQEDATNLENKIQNETFQDSFSSKVQTSESHSSFGQATTYESQTTDKSAEFLEKNLGEQGIVKLSSMVEGILTKEETKSEEYRSISSTIAETSISTKIISEKVIQKDEVFNSSLQTKEIKTPGSTTGSDVSLQSTKSQDTIIEREKSLDFLGLTSATKETGKTKSTDPAEFKYEKYSDDVSNSHTKAVEQEESTKTRSIQDSDAMGEQITETEERKSPLDDVFSTSSSSDYKGGSNEASSQEKSNIIIRKHKKSTLGAKDQKSDGEIYSSSGSHYESFEQTSESIKTPGSRPLSSDIEGLVATVAGMTTGSSEYESAVSHELSGQSTTITSKEYQTAVSSLSSRDSMKSLDSESSGNLASIEVSSEASETLVPSAMELEKDTEEPYIKQQKKAPFSTDDQMKVQSFSESIEQSVSFDISGEEISEDDDEMQAQLDKDKLQRMKRSHEMTFQPDPRPIVLEEATILAQDDKLNSSLDDMSSLVSTTDTGANRTVIELSKTESERMDGSATSEQLSLTVSGTSDILSLSESRNAEETTVLSRVETIATQSPSSQLSAGTVESVTITTSSIVEQGIQSVCTQVTSKVEVRDESHSNGPTQVDYNAEYDEGDHEVKKKGHRRNGSTSFRPSMIPVFHGRDSKKKSEDIVEDSAESDKYSQPLTVKEGRQEEKKDVDETERLEEEFYKTEADQAMNRDMREGRISIGESYGEGAKSFDSCSLGTKSRLPSTFSDDHPDSEIAELLKQCSSDIPSEDPIERPLTPEPVEECELKDDTPEFSSEAQASVTELEMEYSGAFSRAGEYAAHVSPIREKEVPSHELWEHLSDDEPNIDDEFLHSRDPLHLGFEDSASEKHELETQEMISKEKPLDRSKYVSSPVPDITVTQHMHPTPQDSFENIEIEPEPEKSSDDFKPGGDPSAPSDKTNTTGIPPAEIASKVRDPLKEDKKDQDSVSDSPTSDSFELLEKPDIADEFVIIEEVGREASEQDMEGKSVQIDRKKVTQRAASSSAPPVISPPTTVTKMTQVKYFSSGATEEEIPFDFDSGSPAKSAKSEKESSQEGSPPSAEEPDFKPDLEASKKWMEMQFQGESAAQIYGYDMEYERGPLEDIKEEDINDLEGSSKIGSMGSQVSQSIGSFGSVKESLSSTPDYDVLAGRKFFTRSGDHDDVSMSSLQEFERLEHLIALESSKHRSLGSQDSLTSSSNSRKHGSRSGGDDVSLASLKEFEGLESACIAAEKIETKAKAEEELLSEIEEGHESQASESESCATISVGAMQRGESDEDDYERRMFEIDEIIRQAQTNVEQFMDSKSKETLEAGLKSETLGRADSLEEISKVPELDLDQPLYSVSYSSGKSYIQQWEDLGDDLITSTDSLEQKTQKSKTSIVDPFTTSTDSLEIKMSHDIMSVSTDSIEASQKAKKKDVMTDSIEVGEKTSMITSVDSLDGKITQANSLDEDEHHAMGTYDQSSSSGKEGDLSSSGKDDSAEGAVGMTNRMPPPRAEYLLGSTDSLEPTSSTATHATYQYETDSVMSSSFTSGDSTTMVDDNDEEGTARASMWFDEGKPYVTEVIEPIIGDDEFSHVIHRKVEMPPEIHKVSFKGTEAEHALREYLEKFDPGEDCTETREVDEHGNVHVKRVIQKRVIVRPEELGGDTTDLSGPDLEKYLQTLTQSQMETEPFIDSIHTSSESHSTVTTSLKTTTTTLSQGETIKTEQEPKQIVETHRRGSRPPLKYDISVDEEPEFDPREHDWRFNLHTHLERDEETQEGAYGYTESKTKGTKDERQSKK